MMRIRAFSISILMLFFGTDRFAYSQTNDCLATTQDSANVRAEPSTDATVLGLLIPTNPAEVIATRAGWYQVQRDDFGTGWVSAQVVTLSGDCASITAEWNPFILPLDLTGMDILFGEFRDGLWNLYAMDVSGNNVRQLTAGGVVEPVWSPDGSQAVFSADPMQQGLDIYWMSGDGSIVRNLTQDGAFNRYPMWSPDGSQIAFWSMRDAPESIEEPLTDLNFAYIYVMNADGSDLHRVVPPHDGPTQWFNSSEFPQGWTDDGRIIFISSRDNTADYALDMRLYSIRPGGSDLINLTPPSWNTPEASRIVYYTELSADGRQIVFSAIYNEVIDLYVMNVDGSNLRQLTNDLRFESNFQWSPDGSKIAFLGDVDRFDELPTDVFVINADGTGERNLTEDSPAIESNPRWSPDGTQIAFQSSSGTDSNMCFVNADGNNLHCLTNIEGSLQRWLP